MVPSKASFVSRRRRIAAAVIASLVVHAGIASFIRRSQRQSLPPSSASPVELEIVSRPVDVAPASAEAPAPPRPSAIRRSRATARAAGGERSKETVPSSAAPAEAAEVHPLMRMRGAGPVQLTPSAETLGRALGPESPPALAAETTGPKRKARLPGTGLTTLEIPQDENVRTGRVHPRFYDLLTTSERIFAPDRERVADEVRGDLDVETSLKRWLFGGLGGDPEALKNQVPSLACLVCVTLRPSSAPEISVAGASGSAWFDRAARSSLERASTQRGEDEPVDPARACYRFAAKVWRTRPEINRQSMSIPFRLQLKTTVQLVTYELLGG